MAPLRPPGLPILAALVVVGMGLPAYLMWRVPRLEADRDRLLAGAPTEPVGRAALWFSFGQPRIHQALEFARFSARKPWFVTHVIAPAPEADPPEPPEIWGIDFEGLTPDVVQLDGLVVRVVLPAPVLLARDVLVGDKALGVPVYARGSEVPDPREMARERLEEYLWKGAGKGLERDVAGARLEVRVGELSGSPR